MAETAHLANDGPKQIRLEEGEVSCAYQDSEGFWTIGVGFLIDKRKGGGLAPEEIDWIFNNRLRKLMLQFNRSFPWALDLDDPRYWALMNMAYQLGIDGLSKFHEMIQAVILANWQKAHDEALDSTWAKQTPARAQRMAAQLLTGEWQWKKNS